MNYAFTFTVVGEGSTEQEAWEDAKQAAEKKVVNGEYDEAENLSESEYWQERD